jgi:hypothetical protein
MVEVAAWLEMLRTNVEKKPLLEEVLRGIGEGRERGGGGREEDFAIKKGE